jgi:hypothetical protein
MLSLIQAKYLPKIMALLKDMQLILTQGYITQ